MTLHTSTAFFCAALFSLWGHISHVQARTITMLGDSITAGYGLGIGQDLASRLEQHLRRHDPTLKMMNHGLSGDTTAGGLARLHIVLNDKPQLMLLALGSNDALRGLPPSFVKQNLQSIIEQCQQKNLPVFLIGARAPKNWGPNYEQEFQNIFIDLAKRYKLPFYPFLLEGVALQPSLNQQDMLHPNAKGVEKIVEQLGPAIWTYVQTLPKP